MEIMLVERDKIVNAETELARSLNDYFIDVVDPSCGPKPTSDAKEHKIKTTKIQQKWCVSLLKIMKVSGL